MARCKLHAPLGKVHSALGTRHPSAPHFARLRRAGLALFIVLLGASTQAFSQADDVLGDVREGWHAAYVGLDAAGVASFFADDARILAPGREAVEGKEAILAYFEERTSHPFTLEFVNPTSWASGDLAFDESDYVYGWVDEGGERHSETGRYIMVYRKLLDGRWLVTHDIWNDYKSEE